MAIVTALLEFNDLGCSVTPAIITMTNSDPYVNDVNHKDDNYENYVVIGFGQESSGYSPERRRPILLRCTRLSAALIRLVSYRLSRRLEGAQAFMLSRDW